MSDIKATVQRKRPVVGFAIAAVVLTLLISELTLRQRFGLGRPLLYVSDPHVGYLPAANQNLKRFGAAIRINAFGMRSDQIAASRMPSSIRLLFIGDSVTFGTTYVDQKRIFTELIKSSLEARRHQPVEVLNASAGGWAPENECRYLLSRGTFDAFAVIFVLNTNDLDQPFAAFEPSPQFPTANPATAIGELWSRYLAPKIDSRMRITDPGSSSGSVPDLRRSRSVLQSLDRAKAFAESRGAQFNIIFSPADYDYQKNPAWIAAVQNLKIWADHSGVNMIDMSSAYARFRHEQIYLDSIHLKPFGHELIAAEFVARFAPK